LVPALITLSYLVKAITQRNHRRGLCSYFLVALAFHIDTKTPLARSLEVLM